MFVLLGYFPSLSVLGMQQEVRENIFTNEREFPLRARSHQNTVLGTHIPGLFPSLHSKHTGCTICCSCQCIPAPSPHAQSSNAVGLPVPDRIVLQCMHYFSCIPVRFQPIHTDSRTNRGPHSCAIQV